MICVSIRAESFAELLEKAALCQFAELRLDRLSLTPAQLKQALSVCKRGIVSCRPGELAEAERYQLLNCAAESGAAYVDIELEAGQAELARLKQSCLACGAKLIVSHHDFTHTPAASELRAIAARCFERGADIAKIACRVHSSVDNARLLGLLGEFKNVLPIGMGEAGRITRIVAPLLGSPFTYAALQEGEETAPGQLGFASMRGTLQALASHLKGREDAAH